MISYFASLNVIQIILFFLLLISVITTFIYYLIIYVQPLKLIYDKRHGIGNYNKELPGVSVIIYAKNCSNYLRENLPVILSQDYPDFEVIVVNDASWDDTEDLLSEMTNKYDNLYHTFLNEQARNLSRKKLSLTLGIKAAKNDIVLFTEANCIPRSNKWIANMARNFTDRTDIVVGYTRIDDTGKLGNRLIDCDMLYKALRTFGYSLKYRPYTAEGTNLAYRKSVFFKNKGFSKYMNLHLGEDDLFVNQVATRKNTKIELSPDSFITAKTDSKKFAWFIKNFNRAFTSGFYGYETKLTFGVESLNRYIQLALFVCCYIMLPHSAPTFIIVSVLLCIKLTFQILFWASVCKNFNYKKIMFEVPFYELLTPVINCLFKAYSLVRRKKHYTWNLKK